MLWKGGKAYYFLLVEGESCCYLIIVGMGAVNCEAYIASFVHRYLHPLICHLKQSAIPDDVVMILQLANTFDVVCP